MPITLEELRQQLLREEADSAGGSGAFAPPMVLEPVYITPRAAPVRIPQPVLPSRPSVASRIITGAARVGNLMLGLLVPMNSGEQGTGDLFGGPGALYPPGTNPPAIELPPAVSAPEPLQELEPVYISPPPKIPSATNVGNDPIMPPNWDDLSRGGFPDPDDWDWVFDLLGAAGRFAQRLHDATKLADFLNDDFEYRPTPEPLGYFGNVLFPFGPEVFPALQPQPGYVASPQPLPYAPSVFPDPLRLPDPFGFGQVRPDPLELPFASPVTVPGTRTTPRNPGSAPLSPFFQVPVNYRPGRPGTVKLPDYFTSPNPDILDDPFRTPLPEALEDPQPANANPCQCEKPPKKKKPKPKKREVCMQGTYTQREKGILYAPRRQVPCQEAPVPQRYKKVKHRPKKAFQNQLSPTLFPMEF